MPRARLQMREATVWWAANRAVGPGVLTAALRQALRDIGNSPGIGRPAPNDRRGGILRYFVRRVRYYLYYRVRADRVEVLAVWHASRGSEPPIDD